MSPSAADRRAALEDQRDFLLRSLDDLEREHDAGDVDEHDYVALKDDYTARAAAVLRAIAADEARGVGRRRRGSRRRSLLAAAAVVVFAVLAGILVAQTAGRREPGQVITGDIRQSITEKLNEAGRRGSEGDYAAAISLYDEVLADNPGQPEALAYKGWMLTLSGDDAAGLEVLLEAGTTNPDYPDAHAFLAVVFFRNGLVAEAGRALDRLDALNPPPGIRQLTDPLRTQVDAALATTTTSAP